MFIQQSLTLSKQRTKVQSIHREQPRPVLIKHLLTIRIAGHFRMLLQHPSIVRLAVRVDLLEG